MSKGNGLRIGLGKDLPHKQQDLSSNTPHPLKETGHVDTGL